MRRWSNKFQSSCRGKVWIIKAHLKIVCKLHLEWEKKHENRFKVNSTEIYLLYTILSKVKLLEAETAFSFLFFKFSLSAWAWKEKYNFRYLQSYFHLHSGHVFLARKKETANENRLYSVQVKKMAYTMRKRWRIQFDCAARKIRKQMKKERQKKEKKISFSGLYQKILTSK